SVIESSDGGFVVTGYSYAPGLSHTFPDILLAKFTSSGAFSWAKMLGGSERDYGLSVVELSDGSLVVTGYTQSFDAKYADVLLAKFTSNGTFVWAKTLGGDYNDEGRSVIESSDGGIVV